MKKLSPGYQYLLSSVLFSNLLLGSASFKDLQNLSKSAPVFLAPEWKHYLEWRKGKSLDPKTKKIFSFNGYELSLKNEQTGSYNIINDINELVMVSASRYTLLGKNLHQHPHAIAIFPTDSFYDFVLINISSKEERDLLARTAHEDISACGALVPVNLDQTLTTLGDASGPIWPSIVKLDPAVALTDQISATNIKTSIATLETLGSRFYSGTNAAATTATVKSLWQSVLPAGATLSEVSHASLGTAQNSLILSLPGTQDDSTTVVIGAHLDSINRSDETNAPGADDDASGVATLTEIIRVIKESGATFSRRVEFHAYAAEEVGLLGSNQIAKSYAAAGRKIAGMLQIDMNAFTQAENAGKIFLVSTDTSSPLRRGLKDILDLYLGGSYEELSLSAGTSDHKSWTTAGYHTVFPFEHPQNYNKALHTSNDKSTLLDFSLAARFGKLATLWLTHMAGLSSASTEAQKGLALLDAAAGEIKIAEVSSQTSGSRFAVAVSTSTSSVISCVVSSMSATGCAKDPAEYSLERSSSTKNFFAGKLDLTLADGEFHRFIAYDSKGIALAQRTIQLKQK